MAPTADHVRTIGRMMGVIGGEIEAWVSLLPGTAVTDLIPAAPATPPPLAPPPPPQNGDGPPDPFANGSVGPTISRLVDQESLVVRDPRGGRLQLAPADDPPIPGPNGSSPSNRIAAPSDPSLN